MNALTGDGDGRADAARPPQHWRHIRPPALAVAPTRCDGRADPSRQGTGEFDMMVDQTLPEKKVFESSADEHDDHGADVRRRCASASQ